jgi:C-methyltransferase
MGPAPDDRGRLPGRGVRLRNHPEVRASSRAYGARMNAPLVTERQPHEAIWSLTNAIAASRCLQIVAELGVADRVDSDPVPATELAAACGADADALERVLQLLAAHGVFEPGDAGFRHTAASELLRSDHPMSMRAFARMMGLHGPTSAFTRLDHSVFTGRPAIETVEPRGFWAYLDDHPDEARIFAEAMTAKARADIAAVLDAYDFSGFEKLADIGGGHGHLLDAVLEATPGLRGVLFDLPAVIEQLHVRHERLATCPGDFFVDPLPSAHAYVLMEVLHDWSDAECVQILEAVRRAAPTGATLLVIENLLDEGALDPVGRTLDVIMLAITGGRERTARELNALVQRAGFADGRVIETGARRLFEARAVGGRVTAHRSLS